MSHAMIHFDILLVAALVGLAAGSVFTRDLFRSVVIFMVFGLVMALAWARLRAPDIAIAEVALGAGLVGAMLMFALVSLERNEKGKGKNLDLAKRMIELLDLLKEKTKGNLKTEEEQFIDSSLHQLKLGYMEKAKIIKL